MSYLFAAIAYFLTSGLTIILLRRHFVQFADDIIKQLDELLGWPPGSRCTEISRHVI